jgi:hypothetical protein
MTAMNITTTRAAASTILITDLSVAAAEAGIVLDALYGAGNGTPTGRFQDSSAFRRLCEAQIGTANTIAFFSAVGIDY